MKSVLTQLFQEAVDREEILLFSNDAGQLEADFVPGEPVPPFTAYVWNAAADEWFVRFHSILDEATVAELVNLLTEVPSNWEPVV